MYAWVTDSGLSGIHYLSQPEKESAALKHYKFLPKSRLESGRWALQSAPEIGCCAQGAQPSQHPLPSHSWLAAGT